MGTLNEIIAFILSSHSVAAREQWLLHSPIKVSEGYERDIIKVNQFLRVQLGLLEVDTTQARECLTNETDHAIWVEGFEELVAPVIASYGLPAWNRS